MPEVRYDAATALLVVDVQNDFADPGGGLYVRDGDRALQVPMVRNGELLATPTLDESRAQLQKALTTLPWRGLSLSRGEPAIPTTYEEPHA